MPESYAQKVSRALEQIRTRLLGAPTLVLLDKAGAELATIAASFSVKRRTDVVVGESFLEAEIAETSHLTKEAQVTQAMMLKVVTVRYQGATFTASQDDDPLSAARTWKLRLTPTKRMAG